MLTIEEVSKIATMLQSESQEMCDLAVWLFNGNTNHYQDYWNVRTAYDPKNKNSVENMYARSAFNRMFNNLDKNTVRSIYGKYLNEMKGTVLSSRRKRKKYKDDFKNQQNCRVWKMRS